MAVKIPPLLSKMSKSAQKAWYKKNNMEMPNEPTERSAAVAKRVKVAPRKASDVKPDSVRAINTTRMAAYMAKGGRAPIGAAGSGGNSVMAGSNMSTVRGMITGIKAGFNPKVSLDPYESERAKKIGPRSLKLKKEEAEHVEEGNLANKAKKKEAIRQLGLKAMKAGKVDPARGYIPQRAGREQLKKEETEHVEEGAKEDAEKLLGGPVKTKPKMPPGKQPAGYRYVRALARRAMKAGLKKEEVEQVGEARRMSAAEKLGRAFDQEQQRSAMSRQRGLDLLKQKDTEKMQNKPASGDMTKLKKEETEESTMKYIEEKLTAADPASKWISDFVKSDNPKFAGKNKKERISIALGAYYAKKRGTNEEVELDESHGAEKLGDMLESDADHETKMKRIKIAPTAHLKYLHKYNMGYSGGGDHPMTKHIKDELKNRKMKNEEVEQVDEITGYEGVKDRKDIIKRSAAMYRMGKQTFLDRVKTRAAEMKKEKAANKLAKEEVETVDEGRFRRSMQGYAVLGGYGKTDKVRYQSAGERSREINVGLDDKQEKENARRAAEADKAKMKKEAAEGKTPKTDTEVQLAKKHGDPKKITYGDVIKARIASAKKKIKGY